MLRAKTLGAVLEIGYISTGLFAASVLIQGINNLDFFTKLGAELNDPMFFVAMQTPVFIVAAAAGYYSSRESSSHLQVIQKVRQKLGEVKYGSWNPLVVVVLGVLTIQLVGALLTAVESIEEEPFLVRFAMDASPAKLLLLCFFQPCTEELAFRKIMFDAFHRLSGLGGAYLFTSIAFGLAHYSDTASKVGMTFVMGLIHAFAYHATGRLATAVVLHCLNNSITSAYLLLFHPDHQGAKQRQYMTYIAYFNVISDKFSLRCSSIMHAVGLRKRPAYVTTDGEHITEEFETRCDQLFQKMQNKGEVPVERLSCLITHKRTIEPFWGVAMEKILIAEHRMEPIPDESKQDNIVPRIRELVAASTPSSRVCAYNDALAQAYVKLWLGASCNALNKDDFTAFIAHQSILEGNRMKMALDKLCNGR